MGDHESKHFLTLITEASVCPSQLLPNRTDGTEALSYPLSFGSEVPGECQGIRLLSQSKWRQYLPFLCSHPVLVGQG